MKRRYKAGGAVGAALIAFVGAWEGLRLDAYLDVVGVPTICFGETKGVRMGDTQTLEACEAMLGTRLQEFRDKIAACSAGWDRYPGSVKDAFTSAAYNIGVGGYCGSTMRKQADAGNYQAACDALLRWNKAGGVTIRGLTRRRIEERAMCVEDLA